ncbi:hypothetical protein UFOVP606_11 [uncultured Caudovirales phage]|uniref:Uncharacterized protein n=1 Tax=uncultured Caudovirales phage TaxID=2100421 RepID=A0A6J5N5A3_9CAUD|nr:hypothetical protein UFOVP606_11 [uncultured Caudovirales phage]
MKKFPIKSILASALVMVALAFSPFASFMPAFVVLSALAVVLPTGVALGVLNPAQLTWNGKEVMALNEAIFESVFVNPAITDFHTIVTGIVAKQQIAYLGLLGLVGKRGQGCDPTSDTATATMTEKFWMPESIQMRLEECWTTYNASFFVWAQNKGVKRADLTNTDVMAFIEERATVALDEAKLRHAWFGDLDAATTTDSPAGIITSGTDLSFFNAIDGFWKQIYQIVAATPEVKAASIAKNAGASFVLQAFTATDTTNRVIMSNMQDVLDNADVRLTDREDKVFIVTKSVYDQLKRELKSYTAVNESYMYNIDGIPTLMFDGVPVKKFSFMDRTIRAYQSNGTKWYQPHRIVLTTKANMQIGVEDEAALSTLDVFFDKRTKNNFIDSAFLMDAKVVENYMISVAY